MTHQRKPVQQIIKEKQGIRLDIGCGHSPMPGFVGMDILDLPEVDIVWNMEITPWPLPDECVTTAVASHILEHINPTFGDARANAFIDLTRTWLQQDIADLQPSTVHGDTSAKANERDKLEHRLHELNTAVGQPGAIFINVMNEVWRVLKPGGKFAFAVPHAESSGYAQDPTHINMINQNTMRYFDPFDPSDYYHFYQPKPWKITMNDWQANGNLECVLEKRLDDKSYHNPKAINIVQETALETEVIRSAE